MLFDVAELRKGQRRRERLRVPPAAAWSYRLVRWAFPFCFCLVAFFCEHARAQLRDSFEGPQPTWSLKQADCGVRELLHERDYRDARTGQASEHFRLSLGNGTFVYLVQPIGRAPLIDELRPSLFVRA